MAQEKMAESGTGAGVHVEAKGSVVLLGKASLSGAGRYYPLAAAGLQDLPEDLRRQLVGGAGHDGFGAVDLAAPLCGEGAAVRYLLVHAGHPAVPEGLRRQLTGGVPLPPPSDRAGYFAVGSNSYGACEGHNFVVTILGNNRAAEKGALYSDGLMPAPENVMAARSSPHAVQVCVDATVGAKAGNPIAVGIKAASAGDTHEHGSDDNLSALVGIAAAASAVTAFAAGAASPAVAFGLLVVLLGGLSLAMASVRGP